MRFTANSFLVSIFATFFALAVLAVTVHFQLLDFNFWQTSFTKHNFYSNLSVYLKKSTEDQVVKEGGRRSDAQVLTNLITTENVKDLVDKNLSSLLLYINGKSMDLYVYIPISKLPKDLVPKELAGISETITLPQLFSKLNIQNVDLANLKYISLVGKSTNYIFIISVILSIVSFVLLILLVKNGNRLISPGIALIFAGLSLLSVYLLNLLPYSSRELENMMRLIVDDTLVWIKIAGAIATIMGIILLFVRKGSINSDSNVR